MKEFFPELRDEARENFAELFLGAVESKAETVAVCNKLLEMMSDNPEFQLLFSEQSVDAVELLAQHLEYLEESIAIVKSENQMLREAKAMRERQEHKAALAEELIFSPARSAARRPRRNIVEDPEEANPENSVLLETDSHSPNQQSNDPKMKARIQHLNRIGKFYN